MANLRIEQPPHPNRKKYPFVATVRYKGLVIDVENLDGSTRTGKDPNGKVWSTKFKGAHYGEIRDSKGTDGDLLDVYIKDPPDPKATKAYIIHQNHPGTHPTKAGKYDEDKVILGVCSVDEAKSLYLRHYNRKDFLRSVTEMDLPAFKANAFGENKGEKVAMDIKKLTEEICEEPGRKIRSKGKGKGTGFGKGKGPVGIPKEGSLTPEDLYKLGFEIGTKMVQKTATEPTIPRPQLGPAPQMKLRGENAGARARMNEMGGQLAGGKPISPEEAKKRTQVSYKRT